jgi:hypothetical protein
MTDGVIQSADPEFKTQYQKKKKSLVSFIKFIKRCFIVFEAIINGIVSLISFSVFSLLVYRKTTDFCMLILYPATLLKEFMISNSFFGRFWLVIGSYHLQIGIV